MSAPSPALTRVIAVDWSGAIAGAERTIWLCEVDARGVVRLEDGRSRDALIAEVVASAARDPAVVAGFDFAFSFPDWFALELGGDADAIWRGARWNEARWLAADVPPFWGRAGRTRPTHAHERFRRTEHEAGAMVRLSPSSVFQVNGAGAVGTGSIRGMPQLLTLRERGFAVWPFDDQRAGAPTAIEIWPRLCYGERITKSRPEARAAWLARHAPTLPIAHRMAAERSDDAFDALVSALAMWRDRALLAALPPARDDRERREGRIWAPGLAGAPR